MVILRVCVCVRERERNGWSYCVCVCVRERERSGWSYCVCVCVRERGVDGHTALAPPPVFPCRPIYYTSTSHFPTCLFSLTLPALQEESAKLQLLGSKTETCDTAPVAQPSWSFHRPFDVPLGAQLRPRCVHRPGPALLRTAVRKSGPRRSRLFALRRAPCTLSCSSTAPLHTPTSCSLPELQALAVCEVLPQPRSTALGKVRSSFTSEHGAVL